MTERRDPSVMEYMEERMRRMLEEHLRDTRHTMRSEIAALTAQVVAGNLQSATEYAKVHASLEFLQREVADLKPLKDEVAQLQSEDRKQAALVRAAVTLSTLIVAAAGVVVALH